MKKIIILLLSCAIALTVGGLTVFADSEKAELRLDETSMNFYESDEPQFSDGKYALSEYLSFTLSDGKEVNILTDGSQKTVQILNEDWEEGDDEEDKYLEEKWLKCEFSQPVKRDEVIHYSLTDNVQVDGELNNAIFHAYRVEDDDSIDNTEYGGFGSGLKQELPVKNNYITELMIHIDDDHENPYQIFRDIKFPKSQKVYIQFTFGVEEKEVMALITALPEASDITFADESAIEEARSAYDALEKWKTTEPADPDIQDKVTNYSKLVGCESALSTLKNEEEDAKETAKTDARAALDTADALNEADYTTDSYKTVKEAKAALEAILAKENATSTEIKDATAALKDAISKLEKKAPVVTKKKQPMSVKAVLKSVSFKALKKAKKIVKGALVIKKNQGKVTYKKLSGSKKLTINKTTGKITVKKGTKKGLYKIKVKVSAKGNANYKAGSKTVTVKIRVK